MISHDRRAAARQLADSLREFAGRPDVVVLALPREGVPVAYEVAVELGVSLDVFLVRPLGVPCQEEDEMGVVASGGVVVLNEEQIHRMRIRKPTIDAAAAHEQKEIERRELMYRGGRSSINLKGRTVILVDDGQTDVSTILAAVEAIRTRSPKAVVVARPALSNWTAALTSDAEVRDLVKQGARIHQ